MKAITALAAIMLSVSAMAQNGPQVTFRDGTVEGVDSSGVRIFRGIPFAQPPVGALRWKAPQPVKPWSGVRPAKAFGNDPIGHNIYGDMVYEGPAQSEDCLYLNVWTPAKNAGNKLPVLIYFNGGGLVSGSGSEPRYQGLRLARRGGIIVVTANYREGIFGFFPLPELTREGCGGNQGWLDQAAAIQWVHDNIAAFGGDPSRITINGESAGSQSVCALTCSPLSRDLLGGYICSSGAVVGNAKPITLEESEKIGAAWAQKNGLGSLKEMRALSAADLEKLNDGQFGEGTKCIDGTFLTEQPEATILAARQSQVPCLLGNNNGEIPFSAMSRGTMEGGKRAVEAFFGAPAKTIYDLYGIKTDSDIRSVKGDALGGDIFIAYATWKWADLVRKTSKAPVYRYVYCHPRPNMQLRGKAPGLAGGTVDADPQAPAMPPALTAVHSADIEYAMGNLSTNHAFPWGPDDYAVSEIFQQIYINFVKYGDPNGNGIPDWPAYNSSGLVPPVMLIDVDTRLSRDAEIYNRYLAIDKLIQAKASK